jgi:hypothetical protein
MSEDAGGPTLPRKWPPPPVEATPSNSDVGNANAPYANPAYGNAPHGNAPHGNAPYANPSYANPTYTNPAHANPAYAGPIYVDAAYDPPRPSLIRRIFRPWVVVGIVSSAFVVGFVWMNMLVDGWRTEDRELRREAHVAADSVGEMNAVIEAQAAMLALLASQVEAARDRATELDGQIATKKEVSEGYKSAALAFERCGDKRAEAIAALWSGGSATALIAAADAECESAQAQLNALEGGS